ncbi:unnamed protein product [Linum trigynum]|uniref:Uncharacterized protein n=1 Tax=Linum trigynum TaxID=586398 RepID=A0AAV2CKW3_9ROSI
MGSSTQPFLTTEPRKQQERSPARIQVTTGPKLRIGRLGRRGKLKKANGDSPIARPAREVEGAVTRRRRLLLEEESEDEFVVQKIPSPAPPCPLNCAIQAAKAAETATVTSGASIPVPTPTPRKKKGKTLLGVDSPKMCGLKAKQQRKPRQQTGKPASSKRAGDARPPKPENLGEGVAVGTPSQGENSCPQAADVANEGLESADSLSDLEEQPFEIRRRAPRVKGQAERLAQSSHVRQAVKAFEAGLSLSEPPIAQTVLSPRQMVETDKGKEAFNGGDPRFRDFNEYGSNFCEEGDEGRKRRIDEVEGGIADLPSPKKLFVEDKSDLETVEAANRDWAHLDK